MRIGSGSWLGANAVILPGAQIGEHVVVAAGAGDVPAVRAAPLVAVAAGAARQDGPAAHPAGVDGAEGRGGEGGEHARVRGNGLGDALAPGESGADELAGVALVDRRAGRADGLAAVPARGQQDPAGLGGGVVDGGQVAGGQVDGVDPAAQPYRVGAQPGAGGLPCPGVQVSPRDQGRVTGSSLSGRRAGAVEADDPVSVVGGCSRPRTSVRAGDERNCRGGGYGWPQRCWAAWRVTPSREPMSAQE